MPDERQRIQALIEAANTSGEATVNLDLPTFNKLAEAYLSYNREELLVAQMALREETEKLELAEKVAGIGHWYWPVGSDEMIWSEQIFRIYGLEHDGFKVSLEQALDSYHPDDREAVKEHLNRAWQSKKGFEFELRLVRPDGAVRDVLSRGLAELDAQENVIALFGIFQDVTDRKSNERLQGSMRKTLQDEVRRRTRELRLANQELKDYAYIVSHDLRSPLINIIGFSKDLERTTWDMKEALNSFKTDIPEAFFRLMDSCLKDEIPEAVQFIRGAASKMDRLIHSLLELSRLGSRIPRIERVDLKLLITGILETLSYQLEQARCTVVLGDLPVLQTDAGYLEIIMRNLLSNAVKYLDSHRDGQISVNCRKEKKGISIVVADNGIGIPEDELEHVFLPFRRIGEPAEPGEGMGLAYVQMSIRQCGGDISVSSQLGQGTTFTFTIPQ